MPKFYFPDPGRALPEPRVEAPQSNLAVAGASGVLSATQAIVDASQEAKELQDQLESVAQFHDESGNPELARMARQLASTTTRRTPVSSGESAEAFKARISKARNAMVGNLVETGNRLMIEKQRAESAAALAQTRANLAAQLEQTRFRNRLVLEGQEFAYRSQLEDQEQDRLDQRQTTEHELRRELAELQLTEDEEERGRRVGREIRDRIGRGEIQDVDTARSVADAISRGGRPPEDINQIEITPRPSSSGLTLTEQRRLDEESFISALERGEPLPDIDPALRFNALTRQLENTLLDPTINRETREFLEEVSQEFDALLETGKTEDRIKALRLIEQAAVITRNPGQDAVREQEIQNQINQSKANTVQGWLDKGGSF